MLQIPDFSAGRLLVVGDLMLDRYWSGATGRISPEAPVPVVHVGHCEDRLGGAGNVAANLAALGAAVQLLGPSGDDVDADMLTELASSFRIDTQLLRQPGRTTTVKLRVISRQQQLLRLDFEEAPECWAADALTAPYASALQDADVVLLSDYAKGALADPQALVQAARKAGKAVFVDPKGSDFARYAGATLLTPNRGEFEAVVGRCRDNDSLVARAEALREQLQLDALLVTRSEEGMSLFRKDAAPLHLPAHAMEVFDVTGAGDTVIATLAAAFAVGVPLDDAARLANLAAAEVVSRIGTAQISPAELRRAAHRRWGSPSGVVTESELLERMLGARKRGERVVMTNGCFDILHAGHVAYLEQAKMLGDRLVVAVNDDASVQRLKGPTRPIVPLEGRMAVLAGLASVDWVLPFAEDTPERLICAALPDVLVKGGDYQPKDIAGYDCVTAHGGRVETLNFLPGCSTSAIVETIAGRQQ